MKATITVCLFIMCQETPYPSPFFFSLENPFSAYIMQSVGRCSNDWHTCEVCIYHWIQPPPPFQFVVYVEREEQNKEGAQQQQINVVVVVVFSGLSMVRDGLGKRDLQQLSPRIFQLPFVYYWCAHCYYTLYNEIPTLLQTTKSSIFLSSLLTNSSFIEKM